MQPKSAVFDESKLEWMNGEHLRLLTPEQAARYLTEYAPELIQDQAYLLRLLPLILPRMRMPRDLSSGHAYFFNDPAEYDPAGVTKHFSDPDMIQKVTAYRTKLELVNPFDEKTLEEHLRALCETWEISAGKLIHPLRLALTGKTVSPGLFEMMVILGRETVLRRLDKALSQLAHS